MAARPIHFRTSVGARSFGNQVAGSRSSRIDVLFVLVLAATEAQFDIKEISHLEADTLASIEETHKDEHEDGLDH